MLTIDETYMARCLQLARCGRANAQPNPMVGAVIVHEGRIIGEGYHVRCGEGHAEVNACASVRKEDEPLLPESTIYVSLEPCSHYGKTPPCAELLVKKQFKRCVVGCVDSFAKVQGRGIARLRDAGMKVTVGVLEDECKELNKHFFTFHGKHRPFVTLKWAQSSDGYIDGHISNAYTQMLCHKRRAEHQAILIGRGTFEADHPRLDVRAWHGRAPQAYVAHSQPIEIPVHFHSIASSDVGDILTTLYESGIQSVLVEGGTKLLQSFIDSGLWDECYVEYGNSVINGKVSAPIISPVFLSDTTFVMGHKVESYVAK